MPEDCTHDCSSCALDCAERGETKIAKEAPLPDTKIKKVIAVMSGKGGVGKSLVSSLLAVSLSRRGFKVGLLDADVTGPSIPRAFGVNERVRGDGHSLFPVPSRTGIKLMSLNLLLENESDPVVWRGPIIAGTVLQFWTDVAWEELDFLIIDMPPGTGDVPLTVFQSIPVDGIVAVETPQRLVSMIVDKAAKMASMLDIPLLALVENMSYIECPDCGRKIELFGKSAVEEDAARYGVPATARLPIDEKLARACDEGAIELASVSWLDGVADELEKGLCD
ncbi:MAG: Mrp/NBP35 family ATP-binding protein [Oscillospiraceae bacterium]|nr:Mrp/NBP35 family ATP-binding protein [Oscillospiraceae bacterium]